MKVFLAAPFTQLIDPKTGDIGVYRPTLEAILDMLEASNVQVFNAHRRERWGGRLDEPNVALKLDLEDIEQCDLLIAIIGSPPSPGVQLEIGFAIAKEKRILLLCNRYEFIPYLNRGIAALPNCALLKYESDADLLRIIKEHTLRVQSSTRAASPT